MQHFKHMYNINVSLIAVLRSAMSWWKLNIECGVSGSKPIQIRSGIFKLKTLWFSWKNFSRYGPWPVRKWALSYPGYLGRNCTIYTHLYWYDPFLLPS